MNKFFPLLLLLILTLGCVSLTSHKKTLEAEKTKAFEDGIIEGVYRSMITLKSSTNTVQGIHALESFVFEQSVRRRR